MPDRDPLRDWVSVFGSFGSFLTDLSHTCLGLPSIRKLRKNALLPMVSQAKLLESYSKGDVSHMGKRKTTEKKSKTRTPETPEAREQQMISLAIDLAEKQLRDGTASTQVITHYLKLGSSREQMEQKMLASKTELVEAKIDSLQSAREIERLYSEAMQAMRIYGGKESSTDFGEDI